MRVTSAVGAVAAVAALVCLSGSATANGALLEDIDAWKREHSGEVDACAVSSNATGHVTVWFTVDAQAGGKTTVAEILPEQRTVGPTPCWRKLLETFRPRSPTKAYAWATCTVFRPGKNAPPTEKPHASLCATWFEDVDTVPERLVAWLVETQLAPALPSLAKCVEQHGKHLPALELVMENAYSPTMIVRYLREQPGIYREPEEPSSRRIGACYAERIMAERARLV